MKWHKTVIWRVQKCRNISHAVTISLSMLHSVQVWIAVFKLAAGGLLNVHIVKVTCIYVLNQYYFPLCTEQDVFGFTGTACVGQVMVKLQLMHGGVLMRVRTANLAPGTPHRMVVMMMMMIS